MGASPLVRPPDGLLRGTLITGDTTLFFNLMHITNFNFRFCYQPIHVLPTLRRVPTLHPLHSFPNLRQVQYLTPNASSPIVVVRFCCCQSTNPRRHDLETCPLPHILSAVTPCLALEWSLPYSQSLLSSVWPSFVISFCFVDICVENYIWELSLGLFGCSPWIL